VLSLRLRMMFCGLWVATAVGCEPAAATMGCNEDRDCPSTHVCAPGGCVPRIDSGTSPDATTVADAGHAGCANDASCDDHVFCNGREACAAGACVAGTPPCAAPTCDEAADRCNTTSND